jgi:hypothetical protein
MAHRRFSPDHPWRNNTGAQVLEQYSTFEQVEFGKTLLSKIGSVTKTTNATTGGRRVFF